MPENPYRLPCVPLWEGGVYQIETSDLALGYDPETGKDGVANVQSLQLGNRTLWLKGLLEAGHGADGSHALCNAEFADGTAIPESRLVLNASTLDLMRAIAANKEAMEKLREEAGNRDDPDLSLAGALRTLLPLSWAYAAAPYDYELFTDSLSLREAARTTLLKEIAGDDSIDVLDSGGFREGGWYVLCDEDGGRPELVTVMAALTQRRIRCTTALTVTRRAGRLECCSLEPGVGCGTARHDWLYVSRLTDTLREAESGRLIVRRDRADISPAAFWMAEDGAAWTPAPFMGTGAVEGRVEDTFRLPPGPGRILLRYTAAEPYRVYSLALVPDVSVERIEYIRRPGVVAAHYAGGTLNVSVTPYALLYGVPQLGLDVETTAAGRSEIRRVPTAGTSCLLRLDQAPESLRLRYADRENGISRWSAPATVEVA